MKICKRTSGTAFTMIRIIFTSHTFPDTPHLTQVPNQMLFSTIFNPSSLLMGLQLLSGVMASPFKESGANTGSLAVRDLTWDQSQALAGHNGRRRQLGIAPLVWDTGLEAAAQKYVQSLTDTKAQYIISPVTTRMDQGENSRAFT